MPSLKTVVAVAAAAAGALVALALAAAGPVTEPAAETGAGQGGPCGDGFYLVGDICEPAPPGYVETRSECEMAVESMEAAGVEQDFAAEIAKCRGE